MLFRSIATGSVHTHPYVSGVTDRENPLAVSDADSYGVAARFDNVIDILVVNSSNGINSGVYRVGTSSINGLMFPQQIYHF